MKRKRSKSLLALLMATTLIFSGISAKNVNAEQQANRRCGTDKAISEQFKSADVADLIIGENYPDELSVNLDFEFIKGYSLMYLS